MIEEKVMNRWIVVAGAIIIQLCLGAIYAWSVFTPKLTLSVNEGGMYGFSVSQTAWIFSVGLLVFAIVMIVSGRLSARMGPRKLATGGGIVLGMGYILAGLFGSSFLAQLIFIGVIGGAGIGMAYVVPIAVGVKWFPDKKGMVTGLAVAGFGFGATIWVKSAGSWFGLLDNLDILGLGGVQSVFLIYGIIFLLLVVIGSIVMVDPPANYLPAGWSPPTKNNIDSAKPETTGMINFQPVEMLKKPQFFMVFFTFLFSAISGLMVIFCIKLFGIDALQSKGTPVVTASAIAGTAMAWYAIFNGLGRIVWGTISDKIGRKRSIFIMCMIQGFVMLIFYNLGGVAVGLIIASCIIGFNFGGNFALFPAITADYFGDRNIGLNYGYVFFSYGIAGIIGPQLAGVFKDIAKDVNDPSIWITPFVIAGIACILGGILILISKQPIKS